MSKRTAYLTGIVLTILLGTLLYWMFCCQCCCCGPSCKAPTAAMKPFALSGTDFNYQCNPNFQFAPGAFAANAPISDSINMGIARFKDHLNGQKLLITGYCRPDEANNSAFPNLGFARANWVKNHFVSQGFPSGMIEIAGLVDSTLNPADSLLTGPLSYALKPMEVVADTAQAAKDASDWKEQFNAKPIVLYFNTNQTSLELTPEQRQDFANLVQYLDRTPGGLLEVTGHTDNQGNRDANVKLGQERADFVKDYLVKNGIASEKVESTSKGPDQPIADNTSAEGRAKNRRTVVSIK